MNQKGSDGQFVKMPYQVWISVERSFMNGVSVAMLDDRRVEQVGNHWKPDETDLADEYKNQTMKRVKT